MQSNCSFKPLCLLQLLLVSVCAVSTSVRADISDASLDAIVAPYAENQVILGQVLVARQGQIVYHRMLTNNNSPDVDRTYKNNRFLIASLSKSIVAALALKLSEQGKLNLHTGLDRVLPDFKAHWAADVTLHHLLGNRSGLANHFALPGWGSGRYQRMSDAELLEAIAAQPLSFEPGSGHQYTNLGWFLLGKAIETTTGKSLADNLDALIFTPYSMGQSGLAKVTTTGIVNGYRWANNGGWRVHPPLIGPAFEGGAGIYASAEDMAKFLHAVHGDTLLSRSSQGQLFSKETPYGWRVDTVPMGNGRAKTLHSYDGQLEGHSSLIYHFVEDDLSVIVLANNGPGVAHKQALANAISASMLTLPVKSPTQRPSFVLHNALAQGNWQATLAKVSTQVIVDTDTAALVLDLARQLEWSGNRHKAIDLYQWLTRSFPDNSVFSGPLQRLCRDTADRHCPSKLNVGMRLLPLNDPGRRAWRSDKPRPMSTHLFYPTRDADIDRVTLGPAHAPLFHAGNAVRDAAPTGGKKPLVLMSHGTGGSALQMLWLADVLVQQGYVVAGVNHHGNTAFERDKYPEGFLLWWERARDLQVVYQQLTGDPLWGQHIDTGQVAVVGFSLGGYTALSALGGITDKALFDDFCNGPAKDFSCDPQPEFLSVLEAFEAVADSPQVVEVQSRQHWPYAIQRLKAAVVIAPAIVHAFRPQSLKAIETPTLLIAGNKDRIAPTTANAHYARGLIPNSELVTMADTRHYDFLSICTPRGRETLTDLCRSGERTREAIHHQAGVSIREFLASAFKK